MTSTTLTAVIASVGAPTLWPWHVPAGRAKAPVSDVVIYDRQEPAQAERATV